uniref:Uncharacterized protein n=1 Tax=viral metagenome TaxID=1070528 RepID=A0A6C0BPF5_9ZZZZ
MNKKDSDLTKDFVETGFDIIKEATREHEKIISYSKLRDLIVNKDIKELINDSNILSFNDDVITSITEEYKNFIKKETVLKNSNEYEEKTASSSEENASEGFLKTAIVLSSIAFNIILIKLYFDGDFRLLQLCGGIVIIIALTQAAYKVIDLLSYSVKNGTENVDKLLTSAKSKLKNISKNEKETETDKKKHILEFLKIYFDMESSTKNSHVKSKQILEHFLRTQESFMIKSENIGVNNKKYEDRFFKIYNFMKNTDITKELIHKYGKKDDDHSYTRSHLYQTFDNKSLTETFKNLYKGVSGEETDFKPELKESGIKNGDYKDEYYHTLIKSDTSKLNTAIKELGYSLNNIKPNAPTYDDEFGSIIKINNAFEILRLTNLPEYDEICNNYLFKGMPEFKKIQTNKDRFAIPDEYNALIKLKNHLLNCDSFSSHLYIKKICEKNIKTYPNDLGLSIKQNVKDIISKITDDNKYLEVLVDKVFKFNHIVMNDVVLKKDLITGKFDEIMDLYETIFTKVFEYSGVIRIDMINYFVEKTDKEFATEENKGKNLFKHNGRKIIDIIFDRYDINNDNLKIINTSPETQNKFKFITYDQYMQKMTAYDDNSIHEMHKNFQIVYNDMDNIIIEYRSGKTKDDSSSIKINILKDMVHYYIASSLFFMLDYFISLFVDSYSDKNKYVAFKQPIKDQAGTIYNNVTGEVDKILDGSLVPDNPPQGNGASESDNPPQGNGASESGKTLQQQISDIKTQINIMEGCNKKPKQDDAGGKDCKQLKNELLALQKQLNKQEAEQKKEMTKSKLKNYENGMKFMTVFSIWILSVVLFYSFWMKIDSDYNYNDMIAINNSLKMREHLQNMAKHSKDAYTNKHNREEHLRLLYEATKDLLVVQEKCNLTKQSQGVMFPTSDVFIGVIIIGICVVVIFTNNMLNNPFEVMKKVKLIKSVMTNESEVSNEFDINTYINLIKLYAYEIKEDLLKELIKTSENPDGIRTILDKLKYNEYPSKVEYEKSKEQLEKVRKDVLDRMTPYIDKQENFKTKTEFENIFSNEAESNTIQLQKEMIYQIIMNHPEDWFRKDGWEYIFNTSITYTDNSENILFKEKTNALSKFLQNKKYNEVYDYVNSVISNGDETDKFNVIMKVITAAKNTTKEKVLYSSYYDQYNRLVTTAPNKEREEFLNEVDKNTAISLLEMKMISNVIPITIDRFIEMRNKPGFNEQVMSKIDKAVSERNNQINNLINELDKEIINPYERINFTKMKSLTDQERKVGVLYGGGGQEPITKSGNDNITILQNDPNFDANSANIDLNNILSKYNTDEANSRLEKLQGIESTLVNMENIEPIINTSVAFSIFMLAIFMSYKIMNNAIKYKVELFNGKLFGESICM